MPFDQWTFIQYSYTNLFYMFFELSSSNSGDGNNGSRHGSTHDSPNLIHSAMRFDNCAQVIHSPGKVRIRKRNSPEWLSSQQIARGRLSTRSKKESRLRVDESVAPAVKNDSGNVPLGIESRGPKHVGELFADRSFVINEGSRKKFDTAPLTLLSCR